VLKRGVRASTVFKKKEMPARETRVRVNSRRELTVYRRNQSQKALGESGRNGEREGTQARARQTRGTVCWGRVDQGRSVDGVVTEGGIFEERGVHPKAKKITECAQGKRMRQGGRTS